MSDLNVEKIKSESRALRGTLHDSLEDPTTGAIRDADTVISKFHGIYQQDDRDVRGERREARLEPLYQFMLRVRVPGGRISREHSQGHGEGQRQRAQRQAGFSRFERD